MQEKPAFVQGVFTYTGQGLDQPASFAAPVSYVVPSDKRSQLIYFRAGNPASELVCLHLHRNGKLMRIFPIGAKAAIHVPLAVVEDLTSGTRIELLIAAPDKMPSSVVIDIGFMEIA